MADSCYGQVFIQTTAPNGANVRVGSLWIDISAAPVIGEAVCSGVGPIAWTAKAWRGTGVPAASLGANGDTYARSDGGALSHLYFKAAGAWTGIA